jgi:hypothetical protein
MSQEKTNKLYACWSAVVNDLDHQLVRADMMFLNIVYTDPDSGDLTFRRIRGNKEHREGAQSIVWTSARRIRITSGPRKGKIVRPGDLTPEERFVESGCDKRLKRGRSSSCFNLDKPQQKEMWDLARGIEHAIEVDALPAPNLYLTCPAEEESLYVRNTGHAVRFLTSFDGYSASKTANENLRNLREDIQMCVGKGRVGYPYEIATGKGVVAADIEGTDMIVGQWYSLSEQNNGKYPIGTVVDIQDML